MDKIDISIIDEERKFQIGTRYVGPGAERFRYGKVDFGILGKVTGKVIRNIQYRWFPENQFAAWAVQREMEIQENEI